MTHLSMFWCFLPLEADNHSRCTELIEVSFLSVGFTLGTRGTDVITVLLTPIYLKSSSVFSSICTLVINNKIFSTAVLLIPSLEGKSIV